MTDLEKLDWRVPTPEWERFREYVQDEFGDIRGYLGEEAETAMIEYAELDEYASVESKVHSLVEAAGRRPFKEKNSGLRDEIETDDTTRVTAKVKPEVKAGFREELQHTENSFGVEFARAIRQYRQHPRGERLNEELDRILDDAQRLLSDLQRDDEDTDDSSDGLSLAERKTIAVCDELGEQFTDDELVDTIERVAEVSSEPSIGKYRGLVVDRLGMERHPGEPHLWVPHDVVDQLAPGQPRVIRQSVERLDREERVRRVQLAVGRAAAERDSDIVRVQTPVIQEEVLGGEVTRSSTLSLMRAAQLSAGIEVDDDSSPAALVVDVQMIEEVDSELAATILRYHDEAEEGLLGSPTSTTVDDYIETPGGNKVHPKNKSAYSDGGSYRNGSLSHMPGFGGDDEEDDSDE